MKFKELLHKYDSELHKIGINPKECTDFCGQVGLRGLEDEKIQLEHALWMIHKLIDTAEFSSTQSFLNLGIVQGILWCTKLRNILEIKNEQIGF